MKNWHIVLVILLVFAASQVVNTGSQSTLFREANTFIEDYYDIGVNPTVLVRCTTDSELVEVYSIPNNLSETFQVAIWPTLDPTTPFQFIPEHTPVNPGETVVIKLKHLGAAPGIYTIPVVIGVWTNMWEMDMHGIITIDKVEV